MTVKAETKGTDVQFDLGAVAAEWGGLALDGLCEVERAFEHVEEIILLANHRPSPFILAQLNLLSEEIRARDASAPLPSRDEQQLAQWQVEHSLAS